MSPEPRVTSTPGAEGRLAAVADGLRASQAGWIHEGRLPYLLAPECYTSPAYHQREQAALFQPAWHFVGTLDELAPAGGFLTRELLGTPVIVRREGPEVRAFLNVCAHRHCRLTDLRRGASPRLSCQYHGWEYDAAGKVAKVPDAGAFRPIRRGQDSLRGFRTATAGPLVFVSLQDQGPDLHAFLGPATLARISEDFDAAMAQVDAWEADHPANWKVVIENTLEGYHVPVVHPRTLGPLPEEKLSSHQLGPDFTAFDFRVPPPSRLVGLTWAGLRRNFRPTYGHHHCFPALTLSSTPVASYVQAVHPTSPTTCHSVVRLFVCQGDRGTRLQRLLARKVVGPPAARLARAVFDEDAGIVAQVQRGLAVSPFAGQLGAREERIWAFQRHVVERCGAGATPEPL